MVSNDHLRYVFEGLSSDGKYYVLAEIPISVKFLPEDPPDEFEGYKQSYLFEDYETSDTIKRRYRNYISSITTRLDNLSPNDFNPSLRYLEEMISSLKIER